MLPLCGCGGGKSAAESQSSTPSADGARYLLAEEPADAKGVSDVRQNARHGDQVVVVGRVGGEEDPWVDGLAAFSIVDASLTACNDVPGDNCPTPWDYCCEPDLSKCRLLVKVVDDQGRIVPGGAEELLGIKELQTVVVRSTAARDDAGNVTLLAEAVHVRP